MSHSSIIGIDFGCSNIRVSLIKDGELCQVFNIHGDHEIPAIIYFDEYGGYETGNKAKKHFTSDPQNTVYSFKRLITDNFPEVSEFMDNFTYPVVKNVKNEILIRVHNRHYAPHGILSMLLYKLINELDELPQSNKTDAVIAIPAYYTCTQEKMIMDAAELAGIKCLRCIPDTVAIALAYMYENMSSENDVTYAVVSLGASSCCISLVTCGDGIVEVISHDGMQLGGDNFTELIVQWLAEEVLRDVKTDLRKDPKHKALLYDKSIEAKHNLTHQNSACITIPKGCAGNRHDLKYTLCRTQYEKLSEKLYQSLAEMCKKAIAMNDWYAIDGVILAGDAVNDRSIRFIIEESFGKKSIYLESKSVVSQGAAIQGGIFDGAVRDILILDCTRHSIGYELPNGKTKVILDKDTTFPIEKTEKFSSDYDDQPAINIHVVEGEYEQASQNSSMGYYHIELIPAKKGIPQIEVSFEVDASSRFHLSAKDLISNREIKIHEGYA
ncbi:MAG: Hsp70 family protein [Prevotellaceae bacterium]|jgi:molecular chaperone DnaK|nr:Hsp70 family protein [Prevotellaceae bacterium]